MNALDVNQIAFNWPNARACVERMDLAYETMADLLPPGAHMICNPKTKAQVVVLDEADCISVFFCGSRCPEDFIHDGECWFNETGFKGHKMVEGNWSLNGAPAKIHHGFLFDFSSLEVQLLAHVARLLLPNPRKKIFVGGHSLGGALGIIGAEEFCRQSWNVSGVYTAGCPHVGNDIFAQIYNAMPATFPRKLGEITYCIENANDIVTRVPLAIAGYRAVGQNIFLCAPNGVITNPHWWQTAKSDLAGIARAICRRKDVLIHDHYLKDYAKRIQLL